MTAGLTTVDETMDETSAGDQTATEDATATQAEETETQGWFKFCDSLTCFDVVVISFYCLAKWTWQAGKYLSFDSEWFLGNYSRNRTDYFLWAEFIWMLIEAVRAFGMEIK